MKLKSFSVTNENSSRPNRHPTVMADAGNFILPSRSVLAQNAGQYFWTMSGNLFGHFLQVLIPEAKRHYLRNSRVSNDAKGSVYDRK